MPPCGVRPGKKKNMVCREVDSSFTKILESFNEVSKLGKLKLKTFCRSLNIGIEKSFGKKALINVVFNALGISTSDSESDFDHGRIHKGEAIPSIAELQKLKNWEKSLSIPQLMDESLVKEFFLDVKEC